MQAIAHAQRLVRCHDDHLVFRAQLHLLDLAPRWRARLDPSSRARLADDIHTQAMRGTETGAPYLELRLGTLWSDPRPRREVARDAVELLLYQGVLVTADLSLWRVVAWEHDLVLSLVGEELLHELREHTQAPYYRTAYLTPGTARPPPCW